jgi:hypothetical protein
MRVRRVATLSTAVLMVLLLEAGAFGQDPFEVQVYEYETVPRRMWNLETHLNYIGRGTREFDGPVAPTEHQFHLTFELTHGITDHFEMAVYQVFAHREGGGFDFVGWRVRPRISLPEDWGLPVAVSLSGEVGFPRRRYEENSATLEIRPIIEKKFGRWQLDFNPVVGRALQGPGASQGWDFEPGARIGYQYNPQLDLSLEYYGALGPLGQLLPGREQVHQFYPGGDLKLSENLVWNFGIGWGATIAGNRLVYKSRIGWLFGRKKSVSP